MVIIITGDKNEKTQSYLFNHLALGQGTYILKSGIIYSGQFVSDTFNGNGTMIWTNGDKFEGIWNNDAAIKGTMTFRNGTSAQGTVRNAVFYASQSSKDKDTSRQAPSQNQIITQSENAYVANQAFFFFLDFNTESIAKILGIQLLENLRQENFNAYGVIITNSENYFNSSSAGGGCKQHGFQIKVMPKGERIIVADSTTYTYALYRSQGTSGAAYTGVVENKR